MADNITWTNVKEDPTDWIKQQRAAFAKPVAKAPEDTFKKKKNSGLGGWLTSMFSEGGGLIGALGGGAAGGALAGTAILPGIGTALGGLIGAGLGGFGGATLGRLGENKVRDNKFGLGEALKEGAITGVLSAGPLRLLKGGYGVGKALTTGAEVAPTVEKAVSTNLLSKVPGLGKLGESSARLESRAAGVGIGEKSAGKQLGATDSQDLVNILRSEKIPAGHPDFRIKKVEERLGQYARDIDSQIKQANRKLTVAEKNAFITEYKNAIASDVSNDITVAKQARQLETRLRKSVNTFEDVVKQRRKLQGDINYARGEQAVIPGREKAYREAVDVMDRVIGKVSPELRDINGRYSQLSRAEGFLKNASQRATRASEAGGGNAGIMSTIFRGDTAQTLKSKTGAAGGSFFGPRAIAPSNKSITGKLVGTDILGAALGGNDQSQVQGVSNDLANTVANGGDVLGTETDNALADTGGEPLPNFGGSSSSSDVLGASNDVPGNDFTMAKLKPLISQAVASGNKDALNMLVTLYKTFGQPAEEAAAKKASGDLNITKVTSQQYGLAQTGAQGVQDLTDYLKSDPGVLNRSRAPGRGLPVIGGDIARLAKTGEYDAIGFNVADALLRLRTGAQANESEVKNLQTRIMPRAGDDAATVARKLKTLQSAFGSVLERAQNSNLQGAGLEDLSGFAGQ